MIAKRNDQPQQAPSQVIRELAVQLTIQHEALVRTLGTVADLLDALVKTEQADGNRD